MQINLKITACVSATLLFVCIAAMTGCSNQNFPDTEYDISALPKVPIAANSTIAHDSAAYNGLVDEIRITGLQLWHTYWFWIEIDSSLYNPNYHPLLELTLMDDDGNFLKYNNGYSTRTSSGKDTLACIRYRPRITLSNPNPPLVVRLRVTLRRVPLADNKIDAILPIKHPGFGKGFYIHCKEKFVASDANEIDKMYEYWKAHGYSNLPRTVLASDLEPSSAMIKGDPIILDRCIWEGVVEPKMEFGRPAYRPGTGLGLAGGLNEGDHGLTASQISKGIHNYRVYWLYSRVKHTYSISLNACLTDTQKVAMALFEDPEFFSLTACMDPHGYSEFCEFLVDARLLEVCRDTGTRIKMIAGAGNGRLPATTCPKGVELEAKKMYYLLVFDQADSFFSCGITIRDCDCRYRL